MTQIKDYADGPAWTVSKVLYVQGSDPTKLWTVYFDNKEHAKDVASEFTVIDDDLVNNTADRYIRYETSFTN